MEKLKELLHQWTKLRLEYQMKTQYIIIYQETLRIFPLHNQMKHFKHSIILDIINHLRTQALSIQLMLTFLINSMFNTDRAMISQICNP